MPQPPCSWKFDYNFTVSLLCQFVRLNCWDWCYLQIGSIWTELNPQTSCWYPRIACGCGETVPLTPLPPPVGWNCVPDPIIRPAYFICCFWWWRWFSCKVISNSWDPMDCSLPGSSVYGVSQARMLEWVAISFSRGSSQPRDRTWTESPVASALAGRFITTEPPGTLPVSTGDVRDMDLIPGLGRSPGVGNGNHSSILVRIISWTEEPGRL